MKPLFKKIAIVGTGLIGGSIALSIKKRGLANEVVGVSRHKQSLIRAKAKGAIDNGSQKLEIIKGADLVILATPVSVILKQAPAISRLIHKDCLVSDTGSTKAEIVSRLEKLFPNFVGSHPLAGSEKKGVANATEVILRNSLCILTPTKRTKMLSLIRIKNLWHALGVRVVLLPPKKHDEILSFVSHLPHIAAFSLINSIPPNHLRFSASGLKDTTRIAASESGLWVDIFLSNRRNVINSVRLFEKQIDKIKHAIMSDNKRSLTKIIRGAQIKRQSLG